MVSRWKGKGHDGLLPEKVVETVEDGSRDHAEERPNTFDGQPLDQRLAESLADEPLLAWWRTLVEPGRERERDRFANGKIWLLTGRPAGFTVLGLGEARCRGQGDACHHGYKVLLRGDGTLRVESQHGEAYTLIQEIEYALHDGYFQQPDAWDGPSPIRHHHRLIPLGADELQISHLGGGDYEALATARTMDGAVVDSRSYRRVAAAGAVCAEPAALQRWSLSILAAAYEAHPVVATPLGALARVGLDTALGSDHDAYIGVGDLDPRTLQSIQQGLVTAGRNVVRHLTHRVQLALAERACHGEEDLARTLAHLTLEPSDSPSESDYALATVCTQWTPNMERIEYLDPAGKAILSFERPRCVRYAQVWVPALGLAA